MPQFRSLDRRQFVAGAAAAVAGHFAFGSLARAVDKPAEPRIRKALKFGMIGEGDSVLDKFKLAKACGFDGVDMDSPTPLDRDEVLKAQDATGLVIHGAVDSVHWNKPLSHPDAAVRAEGVKALETALRDVKHWGGTTVLLVPAVVNKEVSYADAYQRSQAEIRKVLPLAAELQVKIALENVWNQFLLSPLEMARYIDELESPWIGAYFDVGNIVNYGWPEQWVRILDKRIMKLDIKEFSRKRRDAEGLWKGFDVEIGDGDCDWPAVMQALRDIDFQGWGTAEVGGGKRDRLYDIAQRMDRVFAM